MPARTLLIPHRDGLSSYLDLVSKELEERGWTVQRISPAPTDQMFPVTWIHWPEHLGNSWPPSVEDARRIGNWLRALSRENLLIWTVHNSRAHDYPTHWASNELYRVTAEHAQVHIHHGRASIEVIQRSFPAAHPLVVRVCNLGGYWNLLGGNTKEDARTQLGLPRDRRVLLVLAAVRSVAEYRLILRAARLRGWHVLAVCRVPYIRRRYRPLLWLERIRRRGSIQLVQGPIPDAEVDRYGKACDAVLVARIQTLNSASVPFGFTFAKPVIGPRVGNVGELLERTGNPVFDPRSSRDLHRAMRWLELQDMPGLGRRNSDWLRQNCQWAQVAEAVLGAIEEVWRGEYHAV